jgi:hypothetical protein
MLNTRDMHNKEASEIMRIISLYKIITDRQVYALFPGKEAAIKPLLARLIKQKRIIYDNETCLLSCNEDCFKQYDGGMIDAVWVLADFFDRTEYHTAGDYPVKIAFFAEGEYYEIIHVPPDREILINYAMSEKNKEPPKRIIIVAEPTQIKKIQIASAVCYCTVGKNGEIDYYTLE